jgi:hypothetical protein
MAVDMLEIDLVPFSLSDIPILIAWIPTYEFLVQWTANTLADGPDGDRVRLCALVSQSSEWDPDKRRVSLFKFRSSWQFGCPNAKVNVGQSTGVIL